MKGLLQKFKSHSKKWAKATLITTSLISLASLNSNAQELYKTKWNSIVGPISGPISSNYATEISAVKLDQNGNAYYGGYFSGGIEINGVMYYSTFNVGYRITSAFIAKVDINGNLVWFKPILGTGGASKLAAISISNSGKIFITGSYTGNLVTGSTTLTSTINSSGTFSSSDVFVAKLNEDGNFIWAKSMGGLGTETATDLTVDTGDNVYSVGTTATTAAQGGADFNPGTGIDTITSTSTSVTKIYLSKLDSSGSFVFVKALGGAYNNTCYSVAVDNYNNYFLGGAFAMTTTLGDTSITSYTPTSSFTTDGFILKGNTTTGSVNWVKRMGGSGSDAINRIVTDNSGHIYVAGQYTVPAASASAVLPKDFTGTALPLYFGSYDGLVAKLDTSGAQSWFKVLGGTGADYVYALAIDNNSNVYSSGSFVSKAYFNDADTTQNTLTSLDASTSSNDLFIHKLDSNGNFVAIKQGSSPSFDKGISMATTVNGDKIVVAGSSNVTVTNAIYKFDPELANGATDTLIYATSAYNSSAYYNGVVYGLSLSCNGTPDSTIIAVADTTICDGDSLSITAQYPGNTTQDITFQWEQSTNGTDGWEAVTTGSGDSTLTLQTTALHETVYYRLKTFCANSGDSSISTFITHVTVNALPAVPTISQSGNVLTSSSAAHYQWYKNDTLLANDTAQSLDVTNYGSGNYTVRTTNEGICFEISEPTSVSITGIGNIGNVYKISVYPVPFDNQLTVVIVPQTGVTEKVNYTFTNLMGQVINKGIFNNNSNQLIVTGLASGSYFLNITSNSGSTSFKVIKK